MATNGRAKRIRRHTDLEVFQTAFTAAMQIFALTKRVPTEERYSLTDQVRRASRSVCSNTAEAWRKRRYPAAFVSKLSDAESEAAETQVWIEFALQSGYLEAPEAAALDAQCDTLLRQITGMINHADSWCTPIVKARARRTL